MRLRQFILIVFLVPVSQALASGQPYLVKDINPSGHSSPLYLTKVGNKVFFNADDGIHGQELWVSDGSESGTFMVIDLIPGPDGSVPQEILEFNGKALYQADNNQNGMDWYISDGTAAGTSRVGDIDVGGPGISPQVCNFWLFPWGRVGDRVFYMGSDPTHGRELWVTNGTPAGTGLFKDLDLGVADSSPAEFAAVGSSMFLEANGDLWVSDLTPQGTTRISEVYPLGIVGVNGKAVFTADDGPGGPFGKEPWVSDGTPEGTHILKDINPGDNWSWPVAMTNINGLIYFGAYTPQFGYEWWVTDGTEQGTQMVMDLQPGPAEGRVGDFFQVGTTIFFLAWDPEHGRELWKTDGTPEGTSFLKDLYPGPEDSNARLFIESQGKLYFWAQIGPFEERLWESNGTQSGTFQVSGLTGSSGPAAALGPLLFFRSNGELWALDTTPPPIPTIEGWSITIFTLVLVVAGSIVLNRRLIQ